MEKSLFVFENEKFKKELREDIVKCLNEERKTDVNLNKRLYDLEMDKFVDLMKDIDSYCQSELVTKLRDLIWLYSYLMDIDKKMEGMKRGFKKYFKHKLDKEND